MPTSTDVNVSKLVELTENYSGAEVRPNTYILILILCIDLLTNK